jgi:hypothetical protein
MGQINCGLNSILIRREIKKNVKVNRDVRKCRLSYHFLDTSQST